MARLYNGFDALALGQAVNGLYGNMAQRKANGIQVLGDSIKEMLQAREQEQKEAARRQSAIDYLTGTGGMDNAKATQMVDTVTPEQAVLYLTGRLDKKADTEDERGYEQTIHDRNRGEALEDKIYDNAYAWEDWLRKNGITYGQAAKQALFGQLMQQLGLISSKDWGNSRQGVDQYNDTINALKTFSEKNPEFMDVLGLIQQGMKGGDNKYFDEDIKARLRELGSKGVTDQQREDYLKELINNDKFSYILNNGDFDDAKSEFVANVDNKKLMPYVNLQKLIGTNTTQEQRNKDIKNANLISAYEAFKKELEKEASKPFGEGKLPSGATDKIIEMLKNDKDRKAWSRYLRLRGR